ncbi:lysosomal phospholipase A and acyltransferase-like [Amphiura filiformis]|uniref:lysosomal phospholipase A and acyltransferase-like n=1 Tax=Amphiura filiformis TaxID=82378 RepID=UPI003B224476
MGIAQIGRIILLSLLAAIIVFVIIEAKPSKATKGSPVILVPGDGGNQLWATLNKSSTVHYLCTKKSDLYNLWLNLEELFPYLIECFVDNIIMQYDNKTRTIHDAPGVNVYLKDFGNTSTVEWLDPSQVTLAKYFVGLVNALVKVGYERGVSVRGAPFDFRRAPHDDGGWGVALKHLIEDTYKINGNRKVVLISHSLGGPFTLYFLNKMTPDWKNKFLESFVPIAAPFAGATKIKRMFSSGDNFDEYVINAITVRPAQRTYPSSAFLLPSSKYWDDDEVLMYTPKFNYTVNDYKKFFMDLGCPSCWDLTVDTKDLIHDLRAPGLPVYGIHGRDVDTEEQYTFDASHKFPDAQPVIKFGQGDGTVNMRSLKSYLKWRKEQKAPVTEYEIPGGEHLAILQNATLHQYIIHNILKL